VQKHNSHSHFYNYIEEFHHLEPQDIEKNHQTIQQKLRKQLLESNEKDFEECKFAALCLTY